MTTEIQRADVRLRRVTAIVLSLAVAVAAALVFLAQRWLTERAIASSTEALITQMRHWIGFAAAASAACLLALAIHALLRARAAAAQQRWPVAGARVLRDTPVRRGATAQRVARMLNLLSLLLFLFAAATLALSWRLFGL
ncbi:MAG TPA: hypothetical protein VFS55_17705 [Dokdonella sp.]|nr:hypothetical protein [Dokdonella sp.]